MARLNAILFVEIANGNGFLNWVDVKLRLVVVYKRVYGLSLRVSIFRNGRQWTHYTISNKFWDVKMLDERKKPFQLFNFLRFSVGTRMVYWISHTLYRSEQNLEINWIGFIINIKSMYRVKFNCSHALLPRCSTVVCCVVWWSFCSQKIYTRTHQSQAAY